MSEIFEQMKKAQRDRDTRIRRMIRNKWGASKIARELQVSRARAQQLINRLKATGS